MVKQVYDRFDEILLNLFRVSGELYTSILEQTFARQVSSCTTTGKVIRILVIRLYIPVRFITNVVAGKLKTKNPLSFK